MSIHNNPRLDVECRACGKYFNTIHADNPTDHWCSEPRCVLARDQRYKDDSYTAECRERESVSHGQRDWGRI